MSTLTQKIKSLLKSEKVKNSVRYYAARCAYHVVIRSRCSLALIKQIEALETLEYHGSIIDDTHYTRGDRIGIDFDFEITTETLAQVDKIINKYAPAQTWHDVLALNNHISREIEEIGVDGLNYLQNRNLLTELHTRFCCN